MRTSKQRTDETAMEYFYIMENLANQVDPDIEDGLRIRYIKRGLNKLTLRLVNMHQVDTMDELQALLEQTAETGSYERRQGGRG